MPIYTIRDLETKEDVESVWKLKQARAVADWRKLHTNRDFEVINYSVPIPKNPLAGTFHKHFVHNTLNSPGRKNNGNS